MKQSFGSTDLEIIPATNGKEWAMTIEEVAKGYGTSRENIMMALKRHKDEIRDGTERGVTVCYTPGGPQEKTVLYKQGVIKLGFFIRSEQAKVFRQWATNLVVDHMERTNTDLADVMSALSRFEGRFSDIDSQFMEIKQVCVGLRDEVDEIKAVLNMFISESEEATIRKLVNQVKEKTGMDGRKIVGEVRKALSVASIYDPPHVRLVVNALKNMLGTGLVLLDPEKQH